MVTEVKYILQNFNNIKQFFSENEAPFLYLHLSILDGFISSKHYDKRDDFDFEIVEIPYLNGDVPHLLYISQLIGSSECLVMLLTPTFEINN